MDEYRLRFLHPSIPLIRPPAGIPETTAQQLRDAAAVPWVNANGAANRLRQAIEALLIAHDPRPESTLHERIKRFETPIAGVADMLRATKVIGNAGSHAGELDADDLITAAEFIDLALRLLYDRSDAAVLHHANAIHAAKHHRPAVPPAS